MIMLKKSNREKTRVKGVGGEQWHGVDYDDVFFPDWLMLRMARILMMISMKKQMLFREIKLINPYP